MGADLYLKSITDKARAEFEPKFNEAVKLREEAQKLVDECNDMMKPENGYFRDSYNASNFLWFVELSWWEDITPMLEEDSGYLPIEGAKKFLAMLESKPVTLDTVTSYLIKENKKHERRFNISESEGWFKRWSKDREDLMNLLKTSIETGEKIYCSL